MKDRADLPRRWWLSQPRRGAHEDWHAWELRPVADGDRHPLKSAVEAPPSETWRDRLSRAWPLPVSGLGLLLALLMISPRSARQTSEEERQPQQRTPQVLGWQRQGARPPALWPDDLPHLGYQGVDPPPAWWTRDEVALADAATPVRATTPPAPEIPVVLASPAPRPAPPVTATPTVAPLILPRVDPLLPAEQMPAFVTTAPAITAVSYPPAVIASVSIVPQAEWVHLTWPAAPPTFARLSPPQSQPAPPHVTSARPPSSPNDVSVKPTQKTQRAATAAPPPPQQRRSEPRDPPRRTPRVATPAPEAAQWRTQSPSERN